MKDWKPYISRTTVVILHWHNIQLPKYPHKDDCYFYKIYLTYFRLKLHFYSPENSRKPKMCWCFQGVQNGNISLKWANPLNAHPTIWSSTLKQFVDNSRRIIWVCLTTLWGWCLKRELTLTNVFHICPLALVWSAVNLMKLSWMNVVPATSQNCNRLPPKYKKGCAYYSNDNTA